MWKKMGMLICVLGCVAEVFSTDIPEGNVSGIWTRAGSPYRILGDISIPAGEDLKIESGVEVIFQGHYQLEVIGSLEALGTMRDSIIFTVADTNGFGDIHTPEGGWQGIRFEAIAALPLDSSRLRYCRIDHGKACGSSFDGNGGGIYYGTTHLLYMDNCLICDNSAVGNGGGMFVGSPYVQINNCMFINNRAIMTGGALHMQNGTVFFQNTVICNNSATQGGGVWAMVSAPTFFNCTICNNSATKMDSSYTLSCDGGGLNLNGCDAGELNPLVASTIIYGNRSDGLGSQIFARDAYSYTLNLFIYYSNIEGGQAGIVGKTYAGDYKNNIDALPGFVAPSPDVGVANSDYTANWALAAGSPCINHGAILQGHTTLPFDIAGNARLVQKIDMGAYEFQMGTKTIECLSGAPLKNSGPNHPTSVYDLLGRQVFCGSTGRDLKRPQADGLYIHTDNTARTFNDNNIVKQGSWMTQLIVRK